MTVCCLQFITDYTENFTNLKKLNLPRFNNFINLQLQVYLAQMLHNFTVYFDKVEIKYCYCKAKKASQ